MSQFTSISQGTGDGRTYAEPAFTFTRVISLCNFDVLSFLPLSCCVPNSNFYTHLLIKCTLLPLGPVALLWTHALCAKPDKRRKARQSAAKLSLLWLEMVLTTGECTNARYYLTLTQNRHNSRSVFQCLCTCTAVSTTITQTFACEKIDKDYFLRADMTLACDISSARRQSWKTLAILMLLAYPLGFPLLLLCLLLPQRGRIRELMVSSCSGRKPVSKIVTTICHNRGKCSVRVQSQTDQ